MCWQAACPLAFKTQHCAPQKDRGPRAPYPTTAQGVAELCGLLILGRCFPKQLGQYTDEFLSCKTDSEQEKARCRFQNLK